MRENTKNQIFQIENFERHYLDSYNRLYFKKSAESDFKLKKALFKNSKLGYKINNRFYSVHQLKRLLVSPNPYKLPF